MKTGVLFRNRFTTKMLRLQIIKSEWVKGHAGHEGNERADALAVRGRDEAKSQLSEREHDG